VGLVDRDIVLKCDLAVSGDFALDELHVVVVMQRRADNSERLQPVLNAESALIFAPTLPTSLSRGTQDSRHKSMTMSPSGCAQQISTLPSAGGSIGSGW
jgi:hypothetical protein